MDIILTTSVGPNGDPNGAIDAPKSALFYKSGSFYKINYSGSSSHNWQNVYLKNMSIPSYARTSEDVNLQASNTGSFLYLKTTNGGNSNGWILLSNKRPTIYVTPAPTSTPTPTPTPTSNPTETPTPTSIYTPTPTPPASTSTPTPTPV